MNSSVDACMTLEGYEAADQLGVLPVETDQCSLVQQQKVPMVLAAEQVGHYPAELQREAIESQLSQEKQLARVQG